MSSIKVVVMQPTSLCNLNCKYCYISEETRRRSIVMSDEILEQSIKKIFLSTKLHSSVLINWHAGEPLLAGIDFYRKACEYIKKYNTNNIVVDQSIQTNATMLSQKWCDFLKDSKIGLSVSIDGPSYIHDANRTNWNNHGTFDKVMSKIKLLQTNNISFYVLMVVTVQSLDYPEEIVDFFIENNIPAFGFNVEELGGQNTSSSLDKVIDINVRYRDFLKKLSAKWKLHSDVIKIRELESMALNLLRLKRDNTYAPYRIESTGDIITIKRGGDITMFSPELADGTTDREDLFVIDNIQNIKSLDDLYVNNKYLTMQDDINTGVEMCRKECRYFSVCGGGNPGNKYFENDTFKSSNTNFCRRYYQDISDVLMEQFNSTDIQGGLN